MDEAGFQILRSFSEYLENRISLSEFQERMALAHWNVEKVAPSVSELVYNAVGRLAEFSRGHRTEASLRKDFTSALALFARSDAPQFVHGKVDSVR